VAGSIGNQYALQVIGADPKAVAFMRTWASRHDWAEGLLIIPEPTLSDLSRLYRGASVYIQVEPVQSGQSLRWAQAAGAAIVGLESRDAASIVGPAGYLVPGRDSRILGAAILTLLVEDRLRQELRGQGFERAERYRQSDLPAVLVSRFADLLAGGQIRTPD
jgi:glycosyltransferase involved in cell wall biosynthesis